MQVLRWKVKKLVAIIIVVLLLYLWMRPRKFTYKAEVRLPNTKPSDVWEYVADFSHMINLNPTM